MRGRTKYNVQLTEDPSDAWKKHLQEAHQENLHSMWFPFEVSGDEISFECPSSELPGQLERLKARIADANSRLSAGGRR